jgi:transcriptional regulator with XRE-family HTH domain
LGDADQSRHRLVAEAVGPHIIEKLQDEDPKGMSNPSVHPQSGSSVSQPRNGAPIVYRLPIEIAAEELGRMAPPHNLRRLRLAREWTMEQAALAIGISLGGYRKIERGERGLSQRMLAAASRAFGVSATEILELRQVPLIGTIEANGQIIMSDMADVDISAPDGSNEKTVALLASDTLGGMLGGSWYVFFDNERRPPSEKCDWRVCVVGLDDGTTLLRHISPASGRQNRYHLKGMNGHQLDNMRVAWAAVVKSMVQPATI